MWKLILFGKETRGRTALKMKENETPIYGEVCIRKIRRKRQRMLLTELFYDFSKNTTLHGLRYVTQTGLEIVEKTFWILTFFMSVALSFYFIYNVWYKWKTSPVIVSFSEKHVSVETVPFPAITICPQVKVKKHNNKDEQEAYLNETEVFNNTEATALLYTCEKLPTIAIDFVNASVVEQLYELSLTPQETFVRFSQYMVNPVRSLLWLKRVLTKDGVCFNFNGLAADEIFRKNSIQKDYKYTFADIPANNWTMADGYLTNDTKAYPMRGLNSGEANNMVFRLKFVDDLKFGPCDLVYNSYKIFLHHPADLPQTSAYYFAALPNQLSSMALKFSVVTTSNRIRNYPMETRQCYFPDDKWLRYFQIYTYNNCKIECLSNLTYKFCGCVAFYMPHSTSSEICGPLKKKCIKTAEVILKWAYAECNCLPSCNYINYDAEIHKDDYQSNQLSKRLKFDRNRNKNKNQTERLARVDIFYKDPMFMSIRRSELFGLTDFLGQCGGLLGLFLGFSFLSLIEIFYFLTFRVFYTIKTDLKREKEEGYEYNLRKSS